MSPDHLSKDDIRRFLLKALPKVAGGKGQKNITASRGRELPPRAFARAVGIHWTTLNDMRDGKQPIGRRHQAVLSRFIRDWENGMLEFGFGKNQSRFLVHRQTPLPRAMTMSVRWQGGAKLVIAPRPAANPRLPSFKDIFADIAPRSQRRVS